MAQGTGVGENARMPARDGQELNPQEYAMNLLQSVDNTQISIIEENRNRLCTELEYKIKSTNRVELKQKYSAEIQNIKKAAEILGSYQKCEQYKKDILEKKS